MVRVGRVTTAVSIGGIVKVYFDNGQSGYFKAETDIVSSSVVVLGDRVFGSDNAAIADTTRNIFRRDNFFEDGDYFYFSVYISNGFLFTTYDDTNISIGSVSFDFIGEANLNYVSPGVYSGAILSEDRTQFIQFNQEDGIHTELTFLPGGDFALGYPYLSSAELVGNVAYNYALHLQAAEIDDPPLPDNVYNIPLGFSYLGALQGFTPNLLSYNSGIFEPESISLNASGTLNSLQGVPGGAVTYDFSYTNTRGAPFEVVITGGISNLPATNTGSLFRNRNQNFSYSYDYLDEILSQVSDGEMRSSTRTIKGSYSDNFIESASATITVTTEVFIASLGVFGNKGTIISNANRSETSNFDHEEIASIPRVITDYLTLFEENKLIAGGSENSSYSGSSDAEGLIPFTGSRTSSSFVERYRNRIRNFVSLGNLGIVNIVVDQHTREEIIASESGLSQGSIRGETVASIPMSGSPYGFGTIAFKTDTIVTNFPLPATSANYSRSEILYFLEDSNFLKLYYKDFNDNPQEEILQPGTAFFAEITTDQKQLAVNVSIEPFTPSNIAIQVDQFSSFTGHVFLHDYVSARQANPTVDLERSPFDPKDTRVVDPIGLEVMLGFYYNGFYYLSRCNIISATSFDTSPFSSPTQTVYEAFNLKVNSTEQVKSLAFGAFTLALTPGNCFIFSVEGASVMGYLNDRQISFYQDENRKILAYTPTAHITPKPDFNSYPTVKKELFNTLLFEIIGDKIIYLGINTSDLTNYENSPSSPKWTQYRTLIENLPI